MSATYTVVAADGLGSLAELHTFKTLAKNEDGVDSEFSDVLIVKLGAVPAAPNAPTKNLGASGDGEIAVAWEALAGETLPVLGYKLYSDLGIEGGFQLVFNGTNSPDTLLYIMTNVTSSLVPYGFFVTAVNFNGEGAASSTSRLRSCTYPRTGRGYFDAPIIESVTSTTIVISWTAPVDNGGCNITSYAIYIEDPDTTEAEYDSLNVREKPFLSSYTLDMDSLGKTPGKTYKLSLGVVNRIGEVRSDTVSVLLASVPDTPDPPTK